MCEGGPITKLANNLKEMQISGEFGLKTKISASLIEVVKGEIGCLHMVDVRHVGDLPKHHMSLIIC